MEDLSDPFGDRVMKNVPPLARFPLKKEEIWHQSRKYYNTLDECTRINCVQYSTIESIILIFGQSKVHYSIVCI